MQLRTSPYHRDNIFTNAPLSERYRISNFDTLFQPTVAFDSIACVYCTSRFLSITYSVVMIIMKLNSALCMIIFASNIVMSIANYIDQPRHKRSDEGIGKNHSRSKLKAGMV